MEGLLSAALRRLSMLSRTAARTSAENARTSESEPPCRLLKRSSALASATLAAGDPASKQRHASEEAVHETMSTYALHVTVRPVMMQRLHDREQSIGRAA